MRVVVATVMTGLTLRSNSRNYHNAILIPTKRILHVNIIEKIISGHKPFLLAFLGDFSFTCIFFFFFSPLFLTHHC